MRTTHESMGGEGTLHGWGCTPTGETPPTVASEQQATRCVPAGLVRGWRKTALFAILAFLMIIVFVNIGLTLWIISSLRLRIGGLGPIKIVNGGIELEGHAYVTDNLVASAIRSRTAQPITLHSHRNFTVLVEEPDSMEQSKLIIKRDSIECSGRSFDVRDSRGDAVFQASKDEVRIFSDALAVDSAGGVEVKNAIQTALVRAPPGSDLQLESLTRRLDLRAPQSIHLESRAGSINIISHSNIKLDSVVGSLRINASNIIIPNLKEAVVTEEAQKNQNIRSMKVYQLCACASGKLFLAPADATCTSQGDTELCR